jgi:hypothetical protein
MSDFGYVIMNETWYATKQDIDEILVYKSPDYSGTGVDYEFTLRWKILNGKLVLQVAIFEDSMRAFIEMHQLFTELAVLHRTNPQKADIVLLLNKLGYKDTTERVNPDLGTGSFRDPSARFYVTEGCSVRDKKSGNVVVTFEGNYSAGNVADRVAKILNSENK